MATTKKTKNPPADTSVLEPISQEAHAETVQEHKMAAIAENMNGEFALVNQLLGQTQAFRSIAKFADVVSLTKLAYIKENKLYRALKGTTVFLPNGEKVPTVGTWDEFCGLLGASASKIDEDLLNLKVFGEDALESMTRIGAGYREMRQFRKLPDDQKLALIEVAKTGDKDTFLDLAEEIIARHTKEKEALETRALEAEENYEAQEKVIESKNKIIDQLETDTHKLRHKIERETPDEQREQLYMEASAVAISLEGKIKAELKPALQALFEHGDANEEFMAGLIVSCECVLQQLREEFNLPERGTVVPYWQQPGVIESIPPYTGPQSDEDGKTAKPN